MRKHLLKNLLVLSATFNKTSRGYYVGGNGTTVDLTSMTRFTYSTETAVGISATLAQGRSEVSAFTSSVKGYCAGGYKSTAPAAHSSEIDGLDLRTETAINPSATLSNPISHPRGAMDSTKGYSLGGYNAGGRSTVDNFTYSTETSANEANLSTNRYSSTIAQSSTKAYLLGGVTTGVYTSGIMGRVLATATNANPSATLQVARGLGAGLTDGIVGICIGGYTGSALSSEIDGITYSTEAAYNPSATTTARSSQEGLSPAGNANGYVVGGSGSPFNYIQRWVFGSETLTTLGATLDVGRVYGGNWY